MTWPQGEPFEIAELLDEARAIERDVAAGKAINRLRVEEIARTFGTYTAHLPIELQDATAARLVSALYARRDYAATVSPRRAVPLVASTASDRKT